MIVGYLMLCQSYKKKSYSDVLKELFFITGIGLAGLAYATSEALAQMSNKAQSQTTFNFNIVGMHLSQAMSEFTNLTGVTVVYDHSQLANLTVNTVKGNFNATSGLHQLLVGTGISFRFIAKNQVVLSLVNAEINRGAIGELAMDANTIQLDTLHVQGYQADSDWVYQEPRSVSVISQEQLRRNPSRHAADMLEETPGVYSAVSQQDPGLSVNIRGLQDFGRVNMSIDGMRQNFQRTGHGQRNGQMYIDPSMLAGVTIDKGVSSGMGGAGVIGGIANFRTIEAKDFLTDGKNIGGKVNYATGVGGRRNGTHLIGSGAVALGNDKIDFLMSASERRFGDYRTGKHGKIGENMTGISNDSSLADRLKGRIADYTGYVMRSQLAKMGLNFTADQRLQFSYLRTQVSSDNASMIKVQKQGKNWNKLGSDDVITQNISVDYQFNPNDLVDFKTKLYYVNTKDKQENLPYNGSSAFDVTYITKTYGFQAENTSSFYLTDTSTLKGNYGLEAFYDKTKPDSDQAIKKGQALDVPYAVSMTPEGKRGVGSIFTNLHYNYNSWFDAYAGLRYDRYQLKGKTGLLAQTYIIGVRPAKKTHYPVFYDMDEKQGYLSPTLGIAIKPGVDWLQLFANYGKGWRPPAITEALITGRPHGGGFESMSPNPLLKPEKSKNWEVGFNIFKQGLFTEEDKLGIKVAYFDTKVKDFIHMGLGLIPPGTSGYSMSDAAFLNNLETTRFRGMEYQINYDKGNFYTELSYTHMIGKNNFCHKQAWLGGILRPINGSGMRPAVIAVVPDHRYDSSVGCNTMGSAEHMPMDRGSLTLGTRLFDQKLDMGVRARYSEGYSVSADKALANDMIYPPDWKRYTVYDFYSSYKATDNLTLRLSVENFTDRAYMVPLGDVLSFNLGRGRTVQAGFDFTF